MVHKFGYPTETTNVWVTHLGNAGEISYFYIFQFELLFNKIYKIRV